MDLDAFQAAYESARRRAAYRERMIVASLYVITAACFLLGFYVVLLWWPA